MIHRATSASALARVARFAATIPLLLLAACSDDDGSAPSPTATVAVASATSTVPATRTATTTATALPSSTSTATALPSATSTTRPTVTVTATATDFVPPTETRTPSPTPTITATPIPTDPINEAFAAALAPLCSRTNPPVQFDLSGRRDIFGMYCDRGDNHVTDATIRGFATEEAANEAYQSALVQNDCFAEGEFRSLPAAMCTEPYLEGRTETWVWRDGCWTVRVRARDRDENQVAPLPSIVSETIHDTGMTTGLFATCPPPLPDLLPTSLSSSYHGGGDCRGPFGELGVCVRNQGVGDAGRFSVVIEGVGRFESDGLAAMDSECWSTSFVGGELTAVVDSEGAVEEADESNNAITRQVTAPTVPATCALTPTPTPEP